jgi:hypothetical protein
MPSAVFCVFMSAGRHRPTPCELASKIHLRDEFATLEHAFGEPHAAFREENPPAWDRSFRETVFSFDQEQAVLQSITASFEIICAPSTNV